MPTAAGLTPPPRHDRGDEEKGSPPSPGRLFENGGTEGPESRRPQVLGRKTDGRTIGQMGREPEAKLRELGRLKLTDRPEPTGVPHPYLPIQDGQQESGRCVEDRAEPLSVFRSIAARGMTAIPTPISICRR
jgi:hypothetical protein